MSESNEVKWVGIRPVSPEEDIPVKQDTASKLKATVTQASAARTVTNPTAANLKTEIHQPSTKEEFNIKKGASERLATAHTPAAKTTPGVSSTLILAANAARVSFLIKNTGAVVVYFRLGDNATVNDMELQSGDVYWNDDYTGIVDGITSAGTGEIRVVET